MARGVLWNSQMAAGMTFNKATLFVHRDDIPLDATMLTPDFRMGLGRAARVLRPYSVRCEVVAGTLRFPGAPALHTNLRVHAARPSS